VTRIVTDRLVLRPFDEGDLDTIVELDSDPEVVRWVDPFGDLVPRDLEGQRGHARRVARPGYLVAEERETGRVLGWFHLWPVEDEARTLDLGYRLRRDAWGRGYATEGGRALVAHAWDLGARRIVAHALTENAASIRVLEKCGLRHVADDDYRGLPAVIYALERSSATA
jgi:RimJ/RimL family protein N-acetyltransferase